MQLSTCDDNELRGQDAHDIQINTFQLFQMTAQHHGLWFTIEVNTQEPLLPQFHQAIMAHFSSQGLTLPNGDRPEHHADFGTLPWQLVKMKKRRNSDCYSMAMETSLHAVNITLQNLKSLRGCQNPGPEGLPNWMIISQCCSFAVYTITDAMADPRFGDLSGPISGLAQHTNPPPPLQDQDHPCYGDRFVQLAAPPQREDELRETVQCHWDCPKEGSVCHLPMLYVCHPCSLVC